MYSGAWLLLAQTGAIAGSKSVPVPRLSNQIYHYGRQYNARLYSHVKYQTGTLSPAREIPHPGHQTYRTFSFSHQTKNTVLVARGRRYKHNTSKIRYFGVYQNLRQTEKFDLSVQSKPSICRKVRYFGVSKPSINRKIGPFGIYQNLRYVAKSDISVHQNFYTISLY